MEQRQHYNDGDVISRASTLVSPSDKVEFLKELDRSLVTDRDVSCFRFVSHPISLCM